MSATAEDASPVACAEAVVRADAADVARALGEPSSWRVWAPSLTLTPYTDRGPEGLRAVIEGDLVGTAEWWIESLERGVLEPTAQVHLWVRGWATGGDPLTPLAPGWRRDLLTARRLRRVSRAWIAHLRDVRERVEAGR